MTSTRNKGWGFVFNNLIAPGDTGTSPLIIFTYLVGSGTRAKAVELVEELNEDKDVEKMILADTQIGEVYKARLGVSVPILSTL